MTAIENSKAMVSIVVPCRNERDHIETALNSILIQELPGGNFEVIVADGMSDDGTREIVRQVTRRDSRVRMVDNRGAIVSTGLNAAIWVTRGSIIIRMEANQRYATGYNSSCGVLLN